MYLIAELKDEIIVTNCSDTKDTQKLEFTYDECKHEYRKNDYKKYVKTGDKIEICRICNEITRTMPLNY